MIDILCILLAFHFRPVAFQGEEYLVQPAAIFQSAPADSVGRVGGILNFSNQISGIAAPIITGYVVAARHSFAWAFGVSAIYLVIGIAAYIILLGRIEQMPVVPQTPV
jgi:MFS family permease